MTLIDRYSCELQATMREVTKEMDHIRIEKLDHVKKKSVRSKNMFNWGGVHNTSCSKVQSACCGGFLALCSSKAII